MMGGKLRSVRYGAGVEEEYVPKFYRVAQIHQ